MPHKNPTPTNQPKNPLNLSQVVYIKELLGTTVLKIGFLGLVKFGLFD